MSPLMPKKTLVVVFALRNVFWVIAHLYGGSLSTGRFAVRKSGVRFPADQDVPPLAEIRQEDKI